MSGFEEIIKPLPNENVGSERKLFMCMKKTNPDLVQKMILGKIDINTVDDEGKTILHYAVINNKLQDIEKLINVGADMTIVDNNKQTAFHIAVKEENFHAMKKFIDHGVDVDFPDDGNPPIYLATRTGEPFLIDFLINAGADVNAVCEKNGCTSLFKISGTLDDNKVYEMLIGAGADIHVQNKKGETPLHRAVWYGEKKLAEILIALNADVNVCSNTKGTPLHYAVICGQVNVIKLLLNVGADLTVINKEGRTPLQEAKFQKRDNVVKLITDFTATKSQRDIQSRFQDIQKYLRFFNQTKSLERKIKRHKLL